MDTSWNSSEYGVSYASHSAIVAQRRYLRSAAVRSDATIRAARIERMDEDPAYRAERTLKRDDGGLEFQGPKNWILSDAEAAELFADECIDSLDDLSTDGDESDQDGEDQVFFTDASATRIDELFDALEIDQPVFCPEKELQCFSYRGRPLPKDHDRGQEERARACRIRTLVGKGQAAATLESGEAMGEGMCAPTEAAEVGAGFQSRRFGGSP